MTLAVCVALQFPPLLAEHLDRTAVWLAQGAGNQLDERALPCSAGAGKSDQSGTLDIEEWDPQHVLSAAGVAVSQIADPHEWFGRAYVARPSHDPCASCRQMSLASP